MRTKRFLGQLVMITALAVATAGVMPAPSCSEGCGKTIDIHTWDEQSSVGNPFELAWISLESFVVTIL
jgi:hypothetical protein